MAKFTDRLGRDWTIDVLVMHLPILRKEFGVDLKEKDWPLKLSRLVESSDEEFVRLLGVLCDEQVKANKLTPDDFVAGFNVQTLIDAGAALEDAFTDFSLRSSQARQAVKEKTVILRERLDRRTAEMVNLEADRVMEATLNNLDSTLKNSAGNSPESLELTPTV